MYVSSSRCHLQKRKFSGKDFETSVATTSQALAAAAAAAIVVIIIIKETAACLPLKNQFTTGSRLGCKTSSFFFLFLVPWPTDRLLLAAFDLHLLRLLYTLRDVGTYSVFFYTFQLEPYFFLFFSSPASCEAQCNIYIPYILQV